MVFIPKSQKNARLSGLNMANIFKNRSTKNQVGIEIEVEGKKLPTTEVRDYTPWWKYTADHSLRGEENGEYILANPITFEDVPQAVNSLWEVFKKYGTKFDDSNRTSVHVHLNAQKFHLNRFTSFVALWVCFEELLTEWCGDHRVGNLFCLRVKDAPGIVSTIVKFIQTEDTGYIRDGLHYSALNIHSLTKFGSIEIRTMRGAQTPEMVIDWVKILERLYKMSETFDDPRKICEQFSVGGPFYFMETILGEVMPIVCNGVLWTEDQMKNSLYEGIRYAQDLCYARDWSEYKPVELRPDPFGRDPMKALNTQAPTAGMTHYFTNSSTLTVPTSWTASAIDELLSASTPPPVNPFEDDVEEEFY